MVVFRLPAAVFLCWPPLSRISLHITRFGRRFHVSCESILVVSYGMMQKVCQQDGFWLCNIVCSLVRSRSGKHPGFCDEIPLNFSVVCMLFHPRDYSHIMQISGIFFLLCHVMKRIIELTINLELWTKWQWIAFKIKSGI